MLVQAFYHIEILFDLLLLDKPTTFGLLSNFKDIGGNSICKEKYQDTLEITNK